MNKTKLFVPVLMAMMMLTACGNKKIDAMSNVTVSFDGVDGYGIAMINGTNNWEELYLEDIPSDKQDVSMLQALAAMEESIDFVVEPSDNLSNGDTVTVSVKYNSDIFKQNKVSLSAEPKTFTVEGLTEPIEVDPFEGLDVVFTETAPYGKATINQDNCDTKGLRVSYNLDKYNDLSNGDVVTVTIDVSEEDALKQGYKLLQTSAEFTVDGLVTYMKSLDQIGDKFYTEFEPYLQDEIDANFADKRSWIRLMGNKISYRDNSYYYSNHRGTELLSYEAKPYMIEALFPKINGQGSENILYYIYTVDMVQNLDDGKNVQENVEQTLFVIFGAANIKYDPQVDNYSAAMTDLSGKFLLDVGFDYNSLYNEYIMAKKDKYSVEEKKIQ